MLKGSVTEPLRSGSGVKIPESPYKGPQRASQGRSAAGGQTVGGGENLDEPLRDQAHAIVTTCHSIWLPAFQPRLHRAGTPANRRPRM
jgi:hypothetical protein